MTSEQVEKRNMEQQDKPLPDLNFRRMLISDQLEQPWYKSIFKGMRDRFSPSNEPPLVVTSRPVESASFGALAEAEEPWFKSIVRNLKEYFSPPAQPPLDLTSKPVDDATFGALAEAEEPFYKSLIANVRDIVRPKKLPPLEVTSKPVEVGTIWGAYSGGESKSAVVSVLVHVAVVLLLLFAFQTRAVQKAMKQVGTIIYTPPYQPKIPKAAQQAQGGGGMKQPTPINHGAAPRFQKAFVPPVLTTPQPKLVAPTGISAVVPQIQADNYGDPLSKLMGNTGGSGSGTGIGNGNGDGYGPGSGGNQGGGVYRPGGDVSAPSILVKVDPEYSEEARKAKYSGVVLLSIVVDEHGLPRDIKVIRPLGLGLDQKAVEAVQHWRFVPGRKGGRPVATQATVEVSFRLL